MTETCVVRVASHAMFQVAPALRWLSHASLVNVRIALMRRAWMSSVRWPTA
jgi:hypothetical protein